MCCLTEQTCLFLISFIIAVVFFSGIVADAVQTYGFIWRCWWLLEYPLTDCWKLSRIL